MDSSGEVNTTCVCVCVYWFLLLPRFLFIFACVFPSFLVGICFQKKKIDCKNGTFGSIGSRYFLHRRHVGLYTCVYVYVNARQMYTDQEHTNAEKRLSIIVRLCREYWSY